MNFLSSALSSLSWSSIPYTFKDKVVDPQSGYPGSRSVWTVYDGVNPKTNTEVLIFEYSLKDGQRNQEGLARNCFNKLKLVKFPGIVHILDFIESEQALYLITERVQPLTAYINSTLVSNDAKTYGVHSVAQALAFINGKAQCVHGHLDVTTVYVNAQGDWKLFGFETLTNLNSDPEQPIYRLLGSLPAFSENAPPEVAASGIDAIRTMAIKLDSYRLGVFINCVFNCKDFSRPYLDSGCGGHIPKQLQPHVKRLLSVKPNLRSTCVRFVQDADGFFASSPLVSFTAQLDEVKFQSVADKVFFFKTVLANCERETFPPGYLEHRLIPEVVKQYHEVAKTKETGELAVLVNQLLRLSKTKEVFEHVKPVVLLAWSLPDRSVRLTLLNHLAEYADYLTDSEVQDKVFPLLLTGFHDTNFMIRETTLTLIASITAKISAKQVNQELLKILAKLQMDPKPGIRTNTLVLILQVAPVIYNTSRHGVLITALAKGLRDLFTPCKIVALGGFEAQIGNFSLDEICGKVLGHLAIALMDGRLPRVRAEARRVFDLYMAEVERHAATLPQEEENEDQEEMEFLENERKRTSKEGDLGRLERLLHTSTPELVNASQDSLPKQGGLKKYGTGTAPGSAPESHPVALQTLSWNLDAVDNGLQADRNDESAESWPEAENEWGEDMQLDGWGDEW